MAARAGRFVLYSETHCPLSSRVISHGHLEKGILSRGDIWVTTDTATARSSLRLETRGMALFLISATAAAKTELTNDNFDELVFGTGKSAFIKFQAPW